MNERIIPLQAHSDEARLRRPIGNFRGPLGARFGEAKHATSLFSDRLIYSFSEGVGCKVTL